MSYIAYIFIGWGIGWLLMHLISSMDKITTNANALIREIFKFRLDKKEKVAGIAILLITVLLSSGLITLSFYSNYFIKKIQNGILIKYFIMNLYDVGISVLFFGFFFVFVRKHVKNVFLVPLGIYIFVIASQPYAIYEMRSQNLDNTTYNYDEVEPENNLPFMSSKSYLDTVP